MQVKAGAKQVGQKCHMQIQTRKGGESSPTSVDMQKDVVNCLDWISAAALFALDNGEKRVLATQNNTQVTAVKKEQT